MEVAAGPDLHRCHRASGYAHDPERGVARFVADEGDPATIGRPARRGVIAGAVRELERPASFAAHQPKLVALPAEIGAVNHALAVRGPIGTRFPGGLFIPDLPERSAGARFHPPESSRAPDLLPIAHQDQLFT